MQQAIDAYRHITTTEEFKEMERLRSKARHDEAQALHDAKKENSISIARIMLADREPVEKIMKYTGLTRQEVEELSQ
ncbi:MAG: hypothetical protein LBB91_07380 [Clostridiales bacterium]|nr:hypothetical protein [Clostridiales bacterium]